MTASRAKEEAMTCADDDEEDLAIGGSSAGDEDDEDQMGSKTIVSMGARLAKGTKFAKTLKDCDMCGLPITTDVHKHKGLTIDSVCKAGVRAKIRVTSADKQKKEDQLIQTDFPAWLQLQTPYVKKSIGGNWDQRWAARNNAKIEIQDHWATRRDQMLNVLK